MAETGEVVVVKEVLIQTVMDRLRQPGGTHFGRVRALLSPCRIPPILTTSTDLHGPLEVD